MSKFTPLPKAEPPPETAPAERTLQPRADLVAQAQALLGATDYVSIKAAEGAVTLASDWIAWRESLRDVVRGHSDVIEQEPERYAP